MLKRSVCVTCITSHGILHHLSEMKFRCTHPSFLARQEAEPLAAVPLPKEGGSIPVTHSLKMWRWEERFAFKTFLTLPTLRSALARSSFNARCCLAKLSPIHRPLLS